MAQVIRLQALTQETLTEFLALSFIQAIGHCKHLRSEPEDVSELTAFYLYLSCAVS